MTVTTNRTHEQIIRQAESELITLDKAEKQSRARRAAIDAELDTLKSRRDQRMTQLTTLSETAQHHCSQWQLLQAQERLAVGTIDEGKLSDQAKPADRETRKAKQALEKFQEKAAKADLEDTHRIQELTAEWAGLSEQIDNLDSQRHTVEQVKADAHEAMGESEYREVIAQDLIMQAEIEQLRAQLAEAEQRRLDAVPSLLSKLADWPHRRASASRVLPYQDEVTHILEAAKALYEALLAEGSQVRVDHDVLSQVSRWASDLASLLWLQEVDVKRAISGQDSLTLRERVEQFEQLLDLHRAQRQDASCTGSN